MGGQRLNIVEEGIRHVSKLIDRGVNEVHYRGSVVRVELLD